MKSQPAEKTDQQQPESPAKISAMHRHDRTLSVVAGSPKGFRRIDRLQWLKDHGAIADHQLYAGRRLQQDWEQTKQETSPSMQMTRSGGLPSTTKSDSALDAGKRFKLAVAQLPQELETLLMLFLCPEDHPFSLERCAAIVRVDRKAASYGIRIGLTILARHYGYAT